MADQHSGPRRRFLVAATSVIGAGGVVLAAVPFIDSMNPSDRARLAGAPVQVDFSKLQAGQQITVKWRGKPIWVLHRTKPMLERLQSPDLKRRLRDPDSKQTSQQPTYAQNDFRSIKPEFLVVVALCTHLGCVPTFRPNVGAPDLGSDWPGGYFCPCHGSRYDLSGRVFQGVPAPLNLRVPSHHYVADQVIEIGVDPKEA